MHLIRRVAEDFAHFGTSREWSRIPDALELTGNTLARTLGVWFRALGSGFN